MSEPPAVDDLEALAEGHTQAIAERGLPLADGDLQATARWERDGRGERLTVEMTCVIEGRAARATALRDSDQALRLAGRAAALHARRRRAWPSAGLPDPVQAPADAPPLPSVGPEGDMERVAIASTRGVRAAWERNFVAPEAAADHDVSGEPVDMPAGELPVVFGPAAVAAILDHLRPAFGVELDLGSGPLHGRLGTRVAAPAVHLVTPAGGFDAEGIPRGHVLLIDAGIATGRVHDTASAARSEGAATTGHATRAAALAPLPEHLRLSPGDAEDVEALFRAIGDGLYVPALSPDREADGNVFRHDTRGAVLIEGGRPTAPVRDARMRIDPLAILAGVEALTAGTRTLPLSGRGSAEVPALLARSSGGRSC